MCIAQSILRRVGIRQLSGICWYPAKRAAVAAVNQGGTADKCNYSSLTESCINILSRAFLFVGNKSSFDKKVKGAFIALNYSWRCFL